MEQWERDMIDDPPAPPCSWRYRVAVYLACGLFTIMFWGYVIWTLL